MARTAQQQAIIDDYISFHLKQGWNNQQIYNGLHAAGYMVTPEEVYAATETTNAMIPNNPINPYGTPAPQPDQGGQRLSHEEILQAVAGMKTDTSYFAGYTRQQQLQILHFLGFTEGHVDDK